MIKTVNLQKIFKTEEVAADVPRTQQCVCNQINNLYGLNVFLAAPFQFLAGRGLGAGRPLPNKRLVELHKICNILNISVLRPVPLDKDNG